MSTRKWEKINAENNASRVPTSRNLIAVCENNAENAQQKADGDGWPGRWNFFEPRFLGIGGETQFGGFWDFWSGGVSCV